MAYRRKRNYGKRRYRRKMRRYRSRPRPSRTLVPTGFPNRKTVKLNYAQEIVIDPIAAAAGVHVFKANDLRDPDHTGGGHQPLGFDSWASFYDHFTVTWAKIKVTYAPSATASGIPAYYGVLISDDGTRVTGATSVSHLLEHRFLTRSKGVVGFSYHLANNKSAQVSATCNVSKFLGKKNIVGAHQYQGSADVSPLEQVYFEVWAASVAGTNPAALNFLVEIEYIATFTEPHPLAQS